MKIQEIIKEGGWDSTVTQNTVIRPNIVKAALQVAAQFIDDFNKYLSVKDLPNVRIGHPLGSSAYYQDDPEDKIYGDIDLQIVVPESQGMTQMQVQSYWYKLEDEFVKTKNLKYVHPHSTAGHPLLKIGNNQYVQVDMLINTEEFETRGRFRATPERGVKGLLSGLMFSVLGELLNLSIQHSGVQAKVRGNERLPFGPTRKDYQLVTISKNIETFILDTFLNEARQQGIKQPVIDPLLRRNQGIDTREVKISNLVNAVKGFAKSCETNGMFGRGNLREFHSYRDFLRTFIEKYTEKAMGDVTNPKRDKAETEQAKQRAENDRHKVLTGLKNVLQMF